MFATNALQQDELAEKGDGVNTIGTTAVTAWALSTPHCSATCHAICFQSSQEWICKQLD